MVTVINLRTQEKREYSIGPRGAVIAAYAQSRNDWNTWDYETNYRFIVKEGIYGWHIDDWSAPKPRDQWLCRRCGGTGESAHDPCVECKGTGIAA